MYVNKLYIWLNNIFKTIKIMKLETKTMLAIILIGAGFQGIYNNDYKQAWTLTLVAVIILMVWYNERK